MLVKDIVIIGWISVPSRGSRTLIRLTLQKPEKSAGPVGHYAFKGYSPYRIDYCPIQGKSYSHPYNTTETREKRRPRGPLGCFPMQDEPDVN